MLAAIAAVTIAQGAFSFIDTVLGKGDPADQGDTVTILYKGNLLDGTVFDQNRDKAPLVFELGAKRVIDGMDKGVMGMKVGGRRVVSIPADMGYGAQAVGPIPANSTLIFEVEVLRVDKKGAEPKLEISTIKDGAGKTLEKGQKADVHYKGMFLNGVKFDSSYDRNETFEVTAGGPGVIKGFGDGIVGMKEGEVRKIVIPHQLGYGARGAGSVIPPFSTLVFEIELVKVK